MNYIKYLFVLLLLSSCSFFNKKEKDDEVVARVYEKYLYKEDLKNVLSKSTSPEDSARRIKTYVNDWVRKNVLLYQAENNLPEDQKDFEDQLEDYRASLISYNYEKELIRQKLDTTVTEAEVEKYYNENSKNFELKDNIIKVTYVKIKRETPAIKKVKTLYKSDKPQDRKQLEDLSIQFAENYYFDDNTWLLFDDLLKEIPIRTYNQEQFLQNNRFIEVEDSTSSYFVNIKGFKMKDSVSPLSFEKNNIRNIILNKRKLKLINQMKDNIYNEALDKKQIEIFIPK